MAVPRIIVQTDPADEREPVMLMAERVLPSDMESEHFTRQLVERLEWAIGDAKLVEVEPLAATPG
jgi:hypothetical protein